MIIMQPQNNHVLGNTETITFVSFGNKSDIGKIDTGATTSSLHSTNITIDQERNTVTFHSPSLSDNLITLGLEGMQEVHSADHGGDNRPIVKLDIVINEVPVNGVTFNLNDRKLMDTRILIGQNVLQAGHFVINPNKDNKNDITTEHTLVDQPPLYQAHARAIEALEILAECKVSIGDLIQYLNTAAINRIKD